MTVHAVARTSATRRRASPSSTTPPRRLPLPGRSDDIWHGFVPGLRAGARYGLRVHGPYDPPSGLRCNPHKLLLDPYARAIGWYSVWGLPMKPEEWSNPSVRCVAALLDGRFAGAAHRVLLLFNASIENVTYTLPHASVEEPGEWTLRIDAAQGHFYPDLAQRIPSGGQLELTAHAMALLTQPCQEQTNATPA